MNKNKNKKNLQPTPLDMQIMIRNLVRALVGNTDKTINMGTRIDYLELPHDMPFEADVLRVAYICADKDIPPTADNILAGLAVHCKRTGDDTLKSLNTLLEIQTDGDVRFSSRWIADYLKDMRLQNAAAEVVQIIQSPVGTAEQRYEQAMAIMGSMAEVSDTATSLNDQQRQDMMLQFFKDNAARIESGIPLGPSLKFDGFVGQYDQRGNPMKVNGRLMEGKVRVLAGGDLTIISALRGTGKSTLAGVIAEHNAWERQGFDVLFIHLETDTKEMEIRSIARNCIIPADYLRYAPAARNEMVMKKIGRFFQFRQQAPGHIQDLFCPGWDVFRVCSAIKVARMVAESRERYLLVIIDYLHKINYHTAPGDAEHQKLLFCSKMLKDTTQTENNKSPVHTILFAQETKNEDGSAHVYGGRAVVDPAQLHISMYRKPDMKDELKLDEVDAMKNERWLHRPGELSSLVQLTIHKGNSAGRGTVEATIEGPYYKMYEPYQ